MFIYKYRFISIWILAIVVIITGTCNLTQAEVRFLDNPTSTMWAKQLEIDDFTDNQHKRICIISKSGDAFLLIFGDKNQNLNIFAVSGSFYTGEDTTKYNARIDKNPAMNSVMWLGKGADVGILTNSSKLIPQMKAGDTLKIRIHTYSSHRDETFALSGFTAAYNWLMDIK